MCLTPISIVNPSKYVSLKYRDRYIMQVPCGHCAECQSAKSLEWQFRSYIEMRDFLSRGGYLMFTTLTYSNKYLPYISDFVPSVDYDFVCFNHRHITNFFKLLRTRLDRDGYDVDFKYFLSSEYGARPSDGKTYRPHYHVLFFVDGDIDPLGFDRYVADCWPYGRTDGQPYKSVNYVMSHNVISRNTRGDVLRVLSYVTKYIQKSCQLTAILNRRVALLMQRLDEDHAIYCDTDNYIPYSQTPDGRDYRLKLQRQINQFHRQSLHFGESYLSEIDLNKLFSDGFLTMPSSKTIVQRLPVPSYYIRKLFYDLVVVDGTKLWQLNEIGQQYKQARYDDLYSRLVSRYECLAHQISYKCDCHKLADYVLNYRGRFKADLPSIDVCDRIDNISYFNYITPSDYRQFGCRGLTVTYHGNCKNYNDSYLYDRISISDFIAHNVYFDEDLEHDLSVIMAVATPLNDGKQRAFALKQRLTNLYRCLLV